MLFFIMPAPTLVFPILLNGTSPYPAPTAKKLEIILNSCLPSSTNSIFPDNSYLQPQPESFHILSSLPLATSPGHHLSLARIPVCCLTSSLALIQSVIPLESSVLSNVQIRFHHLLLKTLEWLFIAYGINPNACSGLRDPV